MVREIVSLHIGQCGNQIGREFWKQVLEEHAQTNPDGVFEPSMSTFFRNVDNGTGLDIPIGNGVEPMCDLKARALLIDTEPGPVSETLRGELGDLFHDQQTVMGICGAGNNWAQGNVVQGPEYTERVLEVGSGIIF